MSFNLLTNIICVVLIVRKKSVCLFKMECPVQKLRLTFKLGEGIFGMVSLESVY